MRSTSLVASALLAAAALAAACGSKKDKQRTPPAPPDIAVLDAVPADARAVVGIDPGALASSKLVRHGVDELMRREPQLAARIDQLASRCGVDIGRDVSQIVVALGAGPDDALAIASIHRPDAAAVDHDRLVTCLRATLSPAGGVVPVEPAETADPAVRGGPAPPGRPIYTIDNPGAMTNQLFLAFAGPGRPLIASSRAWLDAALGTGDKLEDNKSLADLMGRVDQKAALWAVGQVEPAVGAGLVELVGGAISAPPALMYGRLRVSDGFDAELAAVLATPEDAAALAEFARPQLATMALVAQTQGLGRVVSKIAVVADGRTVFLRIALSGAEVDQIMEQIDRPTPAEQDTASPNPGE